MSCHVSLTVVFHRGQRGEASYLVEVEHQVQLAHVVEVLVQHLEHSTGHLHL